MMELEESKTVLGMRMGDLIKCVNALQSEGGCGTGERDSVVFVVLLERSSNVWKPIKPFQMKLIYE